MRKRTAEDSSSEPKKFDAKAWLEQRFADPARELPDYPSLRDKIDLFAGEVADLKVRMAALVERWDDIDKWFRANTQQLADDAIKEFIRQRSAAEYAIESAGQKVERLNFENLVQRTVEAHFQQEAPELLKAIYEAVVKRIQPHALR